MPINNSSGDPGAARYLSSLGGSNGQRMVVQLSNVAPVRFDRVPGRHYPYGDPKGRSDAYEESRISYGGQAFVGARPMATGTGQTVVERRDHRLALLGCARTKRRSLRLCRRDRRPSLVRSAEIHAEGGRLDWIRFLHPGAGRGCNTGIVPGGLRRRLRHLDGNASFAMCLD
jgi:hypothetical protein